MKIGIIYCKNGQIYPQDMLLNRELTTQFKNFLSLMGKIIEVDDPRNDVGSGETYYTFWNELDVIYHVAPMMDSEAQRRLIGNDFVILFFIESGSFNPSYLSQLGTVQQIYGVIRPTNDGNKYQAAFLNTRNIKEYSPHLPNIPIDNTEIQNILLTKCYNGISMTYTCSPMNRLFYTPRGVTLEELIYDYPKENIAQVFRKNSNRYLNISENNNKLKVYLFCTLILFLLIILIIYK